MAESESRKRANARWKKRNKEKQNYYNDKSSTKRFIIRESNMRDLSKIRKWYLIRCNISKRN